MLTSFMNSSTMTFANDPTALGSATMPVLPKLPNLLGPREIVTIYIRKEPFRIHKSHLTHYSPFFDAAFNSSFVESQTQSMKVKDVHPLTFGAMVNWLYTQEITDQEGNSPSCCLLVELWIMADRFMMPILQNHAMEGLNKARLEGKGFSSRLIHRIYDSTNSCSTLRSYVVDVYIKDTEGSLRDDDPPEFLVDVINEMKVVMKGTKAMKKKRGAEGEEKWEPSVKRMKTYHVDEDTGSCRRRSQTP